MTIQNLDRSFLLAMVTSAYKFEASTTKKLDEPLMCDCQLNDFYCSFCGCTDKPIEDPFSYSYCSNCKAI
jgi:hypothetical protein